MKNISVFLPVLCLLIINGMSAVMTSAAAGNDAADSLLRKETYTLENDYIRYTLFVENGQISSDRLEVQEAWPDKAGTRPVFVETDADFAIDLMWTGWRAPGRENNADNFVSLSGKDFLLDRTVSEELPDGTKELYLFFTGGTTGLDVLITCQLPPDAFYIRRQLAVSDSASGLHFLHQLWPLHCRLQNDIAIIKDGGFGQPVAGLTGGGGVFFGLEYPSGQNNIVIDPRGTVNISCGHEAGEKIGKAWISSEWAVSGLSPDTYIKLWFNRYLDQIRVAPLRPYLKYNCWCDVRSPESVEKPETVMNEQNVFRIIRDFKRELYDKRGIRLDAFVLDDGWDIYKSDWVLRKDEFPNGLRPFADTLKNMGTRLGIWFGPTGGYSFREQRVGWMKEHGYEVTGDQLCLGGQNYYRLFSERVLDFMRDDHISHFKWDGIQLSCSEPDHGHPTGLYSRKAITDSLILLCNKVRKENPDAYLNITSGTWLSPWWLKYANTIWMQGDDWGYSSVPSASLRDRETTFRDIALYSDYRKNDFWFPVSNLMTVGIIKGRLANLGGESESLHKFTNNAVFCLARGVAMWELYVSPDMLTQGEWDAIASSILWAKDRFGILKNTEMIGGDPGEEEAYGYAHFSGKHGIIACRNPSVEQRKMRLELDPSSGLETDADSLVIERVYPSRWVFPALFRTGDMPEISLDGFETAVYEIYPLEEATYPLITGVTFDAKKSGEKQIALELFNAAGPAGILNPGKVQSAWYEGRKVTADELSVITEKPAEPVRTHTIQSRIIRGRSVSDVSLDIDQSVSQAILSVLFRSTGEPDTTDPVVTIFIDDEKIVPGIIRQEGAWAWYQAPIAAEKHQVRIIAEIPGKKDRWEGNMSVWLQSDQYLTGKSLVIDLKGTTRERLMPPHPYPVHELKRITGLGEENIRLLQD